MKTLITILFLVGISYSANSKEFEFTFFGFAEKNVRVRWEVYTNSPKGYPEDNVRSIELGTTKIKIGLKKNEKVILEAFVIENPSKRSLPENRSFDELLKNNTNTVNFTVFEKKDIKDILTLPQLILKISLDEYTSSLVKEKEDVSIDTDLPIGTLVFFDGKNSYVKPSVGIISGVSTSDRINQYYHRVEDMIKVESGTSVGASTGSLGFLSALTADLDLQSAKFVDFRIEIDNLNKLQAKSYEKDPNDIFINQNDLWLNAVIKKVNSTEDKSAFKLYFVTSKISADKVILKRRVYKEFTSEIRLDASIEQVVDVGASHLYHSVFRYEKLDSLLNYFVDYEGMDMTIVLLNEAVKSKTGNEISNMEIFRNSINNEVTESRNLLMDTYTLLKPNSNLPDANNVNQIIAICKDREDMLEKQYLQDSLGNKIPDEKIDSENMKIREYNRYLRILKEEIKNFETKQEILKGVEVKILQLRTNSNVDVSTGTKTVNIQNYILKNVINGSPGI